MPAIEYNTKRSGCYLGDSASLNIVNAEINLIGDGTIDAGTVLGEVTATPDTFKAHDPAAVDGTETAAGILFHPTAATAAGVKDRGDRARPFHHQRQRPDLQGRDRRRRPNRRRTLAA